MRNQINAQIGPHHYTRYPVTLEHEGRRIAAFVHTKRIVRGKSIFHIDKLGKLRTPLGVEWAIFCYRLTRNDNLVDEGYATISSDEAREWVAHHKAGEPVSLSAW